MTNNSQKIWIVDDERIVRVSLADDLKDEGFSVREFANAESALRELTHNEVPDIIISDIRMPGMDGIEFLKKINSVNEDIEVLIMTAYGTIENAVEAMKLGAYDYILKPFNKEEVLHAVKKIVELNTFRNENKLLKERIYRQYDFSSFIGNEENNKNLFHLIKKVAYKDTTVLLVGETGTGKELLSNIIHFNSSRKDKPFIKVSCAILSRDIFESELFGHVKGAFTGAESDRKGRFEEANEGTIYLDDVDDIPLELQVKLLRVLEQREIERVGSSTPIKVNVRVIASTKKDLSQLVKAGKFREDLFYRLNVFPIHILPLRERKKDIPVILNHYLKVFGEGKSIKVSEKAMEYLLSYSWPGNVRELKNVAERLAILAEGGIIEIHHLPPEIRQYEDFDVCQIVGEKPLDQILAEVEISSIRCALERASNNKSRAAELLGIPVSTLYTKMEKYKLK